MFHKNDFKLFLLVKNYFHNHINAQNQFCSLSTAVSYALPVRSSCIHVYPLSFFSTVHTISQTKQVHAFGLVNGFLPQSVSLCASLMLKYATFGDPKTSGCMFNQTVGYCQNAFLWNTLIRAYYVAGYDGGFQIYNEMVSVGVQPDDHTFPFVLKACSDHLKLLKGVEIHGTVLKLGFDKDVFVANTLMLFYGNCRSLCEARKVFDAMPERDNVSWNTILGLLSLNGCNMEAVTCFKGSLDRGFRPDLVSIVSVLPACGRLGFLHAGKEIHARTIHMGACSDIFVSNALTDMYLKCGCLNLAQKVFDTSLKDEVSYNILIVGYSQTSHCSKSLNLFSDMRSSALVHDIISFVGVISACANLASIRRGKEIHGVLFKQHLHTHLFAANALLNFYTKCGRIDLANKVFVHIQNKDVTSWNIMILGYGMLGEHEISINLFEAIKEDGLEPDSISYIAVLTACSHGGLLEKGSEYFEKMLHLHIKPTHMHYACLIDLLGRAGLMEEAVDVITNLPFAPDSNIWGAFLGACRIHGNVELGCWSAEHLIELKPKHCGHYVLLSNLYAEVGRWDEAIRIRELMKLSGARKNPGCTWVQIGDQVHAFLVGENAEAAELDFLLEEYS